MGYSDAEAYDKLKDADSFTESVKEGAATGSIQAPLLQQAVTMYDTETQKAAVSGLISNSEVNGMDGVVFIAKTAEQLGYNADDPKGAAAVFDMLKKNDPSGAYNNTIAQYARMAFNGKGSKAAWDYINSNYDARAIAVDAMKGMSPDQLIIVGQLLTGQDPWAKTTNEQSTLDALYKDVKTNTGFDAVKLIADAKAAGMDPLYTANKDKTVEVVALFAASGHSDAKATLQQFEADYDEGKNIKLIETIDRMAKMYNVGIGTGDQYQAVILAAKVIPQSALEKYTAYNQDFNNYKYVDPKDGKLKLANTIAVDAYTGKMAWEDPLGSKHNFDVVDGTGYIWNPLLNNGKGGYDTTGATAEFKQLNPANQYQSGQWTFNKAAYANMLLGDKLYGKDNIEKETILFGDGKETFGILNNPMDKNWWSCTGTWCGEVAAPDESGGGGGGGGGSSGSSYGTKTTATENVLYVECNVAEATVTDKGTGKLLGAVNTSITLKIGTYTIQVKAEGYTTRETPVTIGNNAVAKTINLVKIPPSISTFINGIGGIQNLTKTKYLWLFCLYKMRTTSNYDWKTFADSIDTVDNTALPTMISKEDVMYVYYLANGDISSAQSLVDAGKVTILDATGERKVDTTVDIGASGGI